MMTTSEKVNLARIAAEQFVEVNLIGLCRELVAFEDSGLFGNGKANDLRNMCGFAGTHAQSLAINMIKSAALRKVAS